MSVTEGSFAGLLGTLADEARIVDGFLYELVGSDVELVEQIGRHTLLAGGKRLRPSLALLSARATGRPFSEERIRKLGAALELVHMATLLHDDVVDRAEVRRGKPTASHIYGSTAGILAGDVFLSKAMAVLATDGDLEIIRLVSQAVVDLAEGEVWELATRGRLDLPTEDHFAILERKTANFLGCCCGVGALAAGADEAQKDVLIAFGQHLGMAFQIADDLLDYRGQREKTGKARAGDFREGCPTLPLLSALPNMSPDERDQISAWFGGEPNEDEVERAVAIVDGAGGFAAAEKAARQYVDKALDALKMLPLSEDRELLAAVCEFTVTRER